MNSPLLELPEGSVLLARLDARGVASSARPGPAAAAIAITYVQNDGLRPGMHGHAVQATADALGIPVATVETVVSALHDWLRVALVDSGILLPTDPALRAAALRSAARIELPATGGAA
jgi:hypothetical protein